MSTRKKKSSKHHSAGDSDSDEEPGANGKPISTKIKSRDKKVKDEKDGIIDKVKKVEERLKAREQMKIIIISADVSKLPSAHRFTRNQPWLKGAHGPNYAWVADYKESGEGDRAYWKDLNWGFNVARNAADRSDLVITVCSQNLIIGKYCLNAEEFAHIPDTHTGFFEISGAITNAKGPAGVIKMLCKKTVADRPTAPKREVIQSVDLGDDNPKTPAPADGAVNSPIKQAVMLSQCVFVKVISIAAIDMKSVHFLELNSPSITAECGEWTAITDTVRGAGMAARWNSLNWKFAVKKDQGVTLTVSSNATLIGRVYISQEELNAIQPKENGIGDIIKHMTNGKEISGKMKINMIIKQPTEAISSPQQQQQQQSSPGNRLGPPISSRSNNPQTTDRSNAGAGPVDAAAAAAGGGGGGVQLHTPLGIEKKGKGKEEGDGDKTDIDVTDTEQGTTAGARDGEASARPSSRGATGSPPPTTPAAMKSPDALDPRYLTMNDAGELVSIKPILGPPFIIRVKDLTVLDTTKVHLFSKNSLSVNVACGSWGSVTDEIRDSGHFANWINLGWKILVTESSHFRVTVRSRGKGIGSASLSVAELVDMPTDHEGGTEIYAKLYNPDKEIVGKIKVTCRYEPYHAAAKALAYLSAPGSTPQAPDEAGHRLPMLPYAQGQGQGQDNGSPNSRNSSPARRSNNNSPAAFSNTETPAMFRSIPNAAPYSTPKGYPNPRTGSPDGYSEGGSYHGNNNDNNTNNYTGGAIEDVLELPVLAVVKDITLFDLISAHILTKNTPRVKIMCDRKSAITPAFESASGVGRLVSGPSAKWTKLDWAIKVRSDSTFNIFVTSGKVDLGRFEILPADLVSIPLNRNRQTEVNAQLTRNGSTTGKIKIVFELKSLEALLDKRATSAASVAAGSQVGGIGRPQSSSNQANYDDASLPSYASSRRNDVNNNSPYARPLPSAGAISAPPGEEPFIFDPKMVLSGHETADKLGLSFKATITEIDVLDLKPVHLFSKNSPYVSAACAKWTQTTKVMPDAGTDAYWTKLNWRVTVKGSTHLRFVVKSKKNIIGLLSLSLERITQAQPDESGVYRILEVLYGEDQQPAGRIKVTYTLAVIHEDPHLHVPTSNLHVHNHHLHMQHQQQQIDAVHRQQGLNKNQQQQQQQQIQQQLQLQQQQQIQLQQQQQMQAGQYLPPVHPQHMNMSQHGSRQNSGNNSARGAGSIVQEQQLEAHRQLAIQHEMLQQQHRQREQELIQREKELAERQQQLQQQMLMQQQQIQMQQQQQRQQQQNQYQTPQQQHGYSDDHLSASHYSQQEQQQQQPPKQGYQHQQTPHPAQSHPPMQQQQMQRLQVDDESEGEYIEFPFTAKLVELTTVDLKTVHTLTRNQPLVQLLCDNFFSATQPSTAGQDVTSFKNLNWVFPVFSDAADLKFTVVSKGVEIGKVVLTATALKNIPRDRNGLRDVILHINNGSFTTGKVKLVFSLKPYKSSLAGDEEQQRGSNMNNNNNGGSDRYDNAPGDGSVLTEGEYGPSAAPVSSNRAGQSHNQERDPKTALVSNNKGSGGGGGGGVVVNPQNPNAVGGGLGGGDESVGHFSNFNQHTLTTSALVNDVFKIALKVHIKGIAVIDLKSVHTLVSNSPCVNMACGKFVCKTEEAENAGSHAAWENLNIVFAFEKKSTLRILLTSRQQSIGSCNISRTKMLNGRKGHNGMLTLFAELSQASGKPAGKIKLIYMMSTDSLK